jgi:FMN-dependent NADH-azoreductase
MSQVLLITSSPRTDSHSTHVATILAQKLASHDSTSKLVVRNLNADPVPHIDDTFATARNLPPEKLNAAQRAALVRSDALIQELFAADVVVIAAGMINFGIPSTLKAYIDHIVRPGVTFRYSEKGPEGLVTGKKVYLVLARGGIYTDGPMKPHNFQDTYLRTILGFIGITDVEVIVVEGVAFGPEATQKALSAALNQVSMVPVRQF